LRCGGSRTRCGRIRPVGLANPSNPLTGDRNDPFLADDLCPDVARHRRGRAGLHRPRLFQGMAGRAPARRADDLMSKGAAAPFFMPWLSWTRHGRRLGIGDILLRLAFLMIRSRPLASALGLSLGLAAMSGLAHAADAAPQKAAPATAPAGERATPPLIVTIVVDQLSANLFSQYRSQFTGGLKTLADQGLVSINGYQTHGVTVTCAGHCTVLTGVHPTHSGIPANDWIDTRTGQDTYC